MGWFPGQTVASICALMFRLRNLQATYPGRSNPAISDLNLEVQEGEFLVVSGPSGGGKSTLARVLGGVFQPFYGGSIEGQFWLNGRSFDLVQPADWRREVGMIFQTPERQILGETVEAELVLGMENLGVSPAKMRRMLAEVAALLQCTHLLERNPHELSGGEQQRVVIAAMLAMGPRCLVLDEPTSQLDPQATDNLVRIMNQVRERLGLTLIWIEPHLNEVVSSADRLVWIEGGRLLHSGPVAQVVEWLAQSKDRQVHLPMIPRFFFRTGRRPLPLDERTGRIHLSELLSKTFPPPEKPVTSTGPLLLEVSGLSVRHSRGWIGLRRVDFALPAGCLMAVLGENGAGKSTLLRALAGDLPVASGRITIHDKVLANTKGSRRYRIGLLTQNPNDYLIHDRVEDELFYSLRLHGSPRTDQVEECLKELELTHLRESYPRDLSMGERQRVALAAVLVSKPTLLLLDEPTRGLDAARLQALGNYLRKLTRQGHTIVVVTQDLEFVARFADQVMLLFRGETAGVGHPREMLSEGLFYNTAMARLFRGKRAGVVTIEEAWRQIGVG